MSKQNPLPISTVPVSTDPSKATTKVLLWVADGGDDHAGIWAIGWAFKGTDGQIEPRAFGYSGHGWNITHWAPLPNKPGKA